MALTAPRVQIAEPAEPSQDSGPEARRGPGRRRPRVLLVDPDVAWRAELATGLAAAGFEVWEGIRAQEAWAALEKGGAQLVIAEAALEGPEDGFSLCGQLRAEAATADVPVFLLARCGREEDRSVAGSVGADDYLPRPVAVQDVVTLARLVAGGRASESSHESHTARLPLSHSLRALLAGARSGRLVLRDVDGGLTFRHGVVVDAAFAGQQGVTALSRLLCFGTGAYAVRFGPEQHRATLSVDREQLCTYVLPALERFESLRGVGVPLAARLTVDFAQLSRQLPVLPEDVTELVRLFDGRRTVRAVLLECRFPEALAFEAIIRLYMLGVLVPACLVEERERARDVPRFFEPALAAVPRAPGGT
ncbi:response regulator [Myxococcaceae bacterium GXIMD 01537]